MSEDKKRPEQLTVALTREGKLEVVATVDLQSIDRLMDALRVFKDILAIAAHSSIGSEQGNSTSTVAGSSPAAPSPPPSPETE